MTWENKARRIPVPPPGMDLDGWPVWPTLTAIEKGRPVQCFTEGGAVRRLSKSIGQAETVEDLLKIRQANARTLAKISPHLARLLEGAFATARKRLPSAKELEKAKEDGR